MTNEIFRREIYNSFNETNRKEKVNMDEMKIKLSTKFMRSMVSKVISKVIFSKFGIKTDIQINEIEIEKVNDKIHFHANVDADINEKALLKITRLENVTDEGSK